MRILSILFLTAALLGCDVIRDEAGYAGGVVGRNADRYLLQAVSQRQRADRYFMTLSIVAPLAAELSTGPAQADAASTLINAAYEDLAQMYDAAGVCLLNQPNCENFEASQEAPTSAFAFEALAHDMQNNMLALTKQTLSTAEFDGVAQDVLDLDVLALVKSLNRSMPVARRILASYRDTVVVFADAVSVKCGAGCGDLSSLLRQMQSGQPAKTATLGLKEQRVISALRAEMKAAIREAPNWHLQHQHIRGLMYHMDQACRALALQQAREEGGAIVLQNVANCGPALSTAQGTQASQARAAFIAATSNRPVVGH